MMWGFAALLVRFLMSIALSFGSTILQFDAYITITTLVRALLLWDFIILNVNMWPACLGSEITAG